MRTKIFAILAAALLVLTGCAANPGGAADSRSTKLTIGLTYVPNIQFAPFYIAEKKGYFKEQGLDVTLRHHGAQESLFGALANGEEDVVVAGGDEMMVARSQGIGVVDWATVYQTYPVALIVPANSSIHSVADLAGKTVGIPGKYGASFYGLSAGLKDAGIADKVKVNTIGYTQTAALTTHKVDAVVGFTNSDAISIELAGMKVRTVPLMKDGLPLVGSGLGSRDADVQQNKAAYRKIITALGRAVAFAQQHPDQAVAITREYVPALADKQAAATAELTLKATLDLIGDPADFGAQNAETWNAQADFLAGGLLKQPVPAERAYVDLTK